MSETQQQPSTEWVEVVSPDEERRHKQFAETIVEIQSKIDRKERARPRISPKRCSPPVPWSRCLAISSGRRSRFVRRSGHLRRGSSDVQWFGRAATRCDSRCSRIRTFCSRPGSPGALGGTTDRQDFLLINRPVFGFRTSQEFAEIVPVSAQARLRSSNTSCRGMGHGKGRWKQPN